MPVNYGVHASEVATSVATPIVADVGLPYVVGTAPINAAETPAKVGVPTLCTSWSEAVKKFGYSENWKDFTLCEFMYSHFQLFQCQPVIFCNVLEDKNKKTIAPITVPVISREAVIPVDGLLSDTVKVEVGAETDGETFGDKIAPLTGEMEAYGKKAAELHGSNVKILKDGSVVGTLPYVTGYESAFPGEAEGNFFAFIVKVEDSDKDQTLKLEGSPSGTVGQGKLSENAVNVFKVRSADSTCKISIGEKEIITLNFKKTKLLKKDESLSVSDESFIRAFDTTGNLVLSFTDPEKTPDYVTVLGDALDASQVDDTDVIAGINAVDQCMTITGKIPDLIAAPGFSQKPAVSAIMAAKAENVSGLFTGKAVIDVDTSEEGCETYDSVNAYKSKENLVDPNLVVCWPMVRQDEQMFHLSTQYCGLQAQTDRGNANVPYEAASNKNLKVTGTCLADGTEVNLTLEQANVLRGQGIVTALNFPDTGWVAWGAYTACYPGNTDIKDYFIPISRMFDFVKTTVIRTFWSRLDRPLTRRLVDTIVDTCNIWLNGLVAAGCMYGARVETLADENPLTDMMAGIFRVHIYIAPPPPLQELDFFVEYDLSMMESALMG